MRRFLRNLVGPHVFVAAAVGAVLGWEQGAPAAGRLSLPGLYGFDLPDAVGDCAWAALLALAAAAAAILAKRLTGNTLVSACAGALLPLVPRGAIAPIPYSPGSGWNDAAASAAGILAAGIRLLPAPDVLNAPVLGRREIASLLALLLAAWLGPAALAMPLLILVADLAHAPLAAPAILRRTGLVFPLQVAAVAPAVLLHPPARGVHDSFATMSPAVWLLAIAGLAVVSLRARIRQTIVIAAGLAAAWAGAALFVSSIFADRLIGWSLASVFGMALLVPTILWRIAIALTHYRGAPEPFAAPLPSIPALRDVVRKVVRSEPAAQPVTAPASGIRSTVESAVAASVAATLEQIRLTFRGPHVTEAPGTPEQVLWNRLLLGSSGGVLPTEKPEAARARWRALYEQRLRTRLGRRSVVLCAGATPWPLVAALAEAHRTVILVERSQRTGEIAASDLGAFANVTVVRHDGGGLAAIGEGTVDAVLALVEPTLELPSAILGLLKECRRVLRPDGLAAIGFADLALPASREILARGNAAECFQNSEAIEMLGGFAGLVRVDHDPGVLPTTSLAWIGRGVPA